MLKAAIYARYSSDNQREESITAQLRACKEYCNKKNYFVVKEYTDEAFSARSDDRPAFKEMIKDAKAKMFDVIVFHKIDRNSRNEYDYYHYKAILKKAGIRSEYVEQNIDDSPEGAMMETMLVGMAAYYSRNLAREVIKGQKENAYKCLHNGGTPPLGYDVDADKKYVINEKEAVIVRLIFKLRSEGHGYGYIISTLNKLGYLTKRGSTFGKNSLHDLLRNKKYIGIYTYGRVTGGKSGTRNSHKNSEEMIEMPDAMPSIIDINTWECVQAIMEKDKRGPASHTAKEIYALSGLIRCECGAAMVGSRVTSRGNKYSYYKCHNSHQKNNCGISRIKKEEIEAKALNFIYQEILNVEKIPIITEKLNKVSAEINVDYEKNIKTLEQQKSEIMRKINNILDLIEDGQTDELLKQRYTAQKERLAIVEADIAKTNTFARSHCLNENQIKAVLSDFMQKENSPELIKTIFETFIDVVIVGRDEIYIKLKLFFPDGDDPNSKKNVLRMSGGDEGSRTPVQKH